MNALKIIELSIEDKRFIESQDRETIEALKRFRPPHTKKPASLNGLKDLPQNWGPVHIAYAMQYILEKDSRVEFPCGNFEEIHVKCGRVEYRKETITLVLPTTELVVVSTEAIPLPSDIKDRQGLQAIAHILGAFFEIDKGELKQFSESSTFNTKFGGKADIMDVSKISYVQEVFVTILEASYEWIDIREFKRTKRGRDFYSLVMKVLKQAPSQDYWAIHTVVGYDLLKLVVYDPVKKQVCNNTFFNNGKKENRLLPNSLALVPNNKTTRESFEQFLEVAGRAPIILLGPFRTKHLGIGSKDATLRVALVAAGSGIAFRGGSSKGQGLLVDGVGFTGLPSEQTKRRLRIISVAYPYAINETVQIKCPQVDVPAIIYSFKKLDKASGRNTEGKIRFVLSNDDYFKIDKKFRDVRVTTSPDPNILTFYVSEASPPSMDSKNDPNVVFEGHHKDFVQSIGAHRYIAYAPIYHPEFFQHNVFKERRFCTDFANYITTEKQLPSCFINYEGDKMVYGTKLLPRIVSPEAYWTFVIDSNNAANSWFLGSHVNNFDPISNILAGDVPKQAFALTSLEKEEGSVALDFADYVGDEIPSVGSVPHGSSVGTPILEAPPPPEPKKKWDKRNKGSQIKEQLDKRNEAAASKYKAKVPQSPEPVSSPPSLSLSPQANVTQTEPSPPPALLVPAEDRKDLMPAGVVPPTSPVPDQVKEDPIPLEDQDEDDDEAYSDEPPPPKVDPGAGKSGDDYMFDMVDNEM